MQFVGAALRSRVRFLSCACATFVVFTTLATGCVGRRGGGESLAPVAPVPAPTLPPWIEQIGPLGEVQPLAQIRIRFKDALVPVEALESPDLQTKLNLIELEPQLPGHFRFLTPRMVGFQADRALPKATRVRVVLKAGLSDLQKHRLNNDVAWTFSTEPIKLALTTLAPISLTPTLRVTSNVELDQASLENHLTLIAEGSQRGVPLTVRPEPLPSPWHYRNPAEAFDPSARSRIYTMVPRQPLEKAKRYRVEFASGISPARGNLPSDKDFVSYVDTYAPLKLERIDSWGVGGRFVSGAPELIFNNGLVAESAQKNVSVVPLPKDASRLIEAYDGYSRVRLNPDVLAPATSYTITVGADLEDTFGQKLGKAMTATYTTSDLAPALWAPEGLNIFPADSNLQLDVSAVNLPDAKFAAAYRIVQPPDLVYADSAIPSVDRYPGGGIDLLPPQDEWASVEVKGKKNQATTIEVPLRARLGGKTGMLAYGIRATLSARQKQIQTQGYYGLVQLTNLGVFAQWFPDSGVVRVHHLSDGAAVLGASVEVYVSKLEAKQTPAPTPCATGRTDGTGTLVLRRVDLEVCARNSAGFRDPPNLLAVAREGRDWAYARTSEYGGYGEYGYGIYPGWESYKPESRGTIFSDRQLYQPGEKAWFTGEAYYLISGQIEQDRHSRYRLTLEGPNGSMTSVGAVETNDYGTFSLQLPLKSDQPLGYYVLHAKGENGAEITGYFRVAEFKPPNFKVALSLDKEIALPGDAVVAKTQSNYLFGPPVEGGRAGYYATRSQAYFAPKSWERYSFGRRWFWPEEPPSIPSDVLQVEGVVDTRGQSSQVVEVAKDLPYPMTYRVDAQTVDVSNLSVADSKSFTALPSDALIGLDGDWVADAKKPYTLKVIVTDPKGAPLGGRRVHVELQSMNYRSVTQLVEGGETARNQIEYKTVAQADVSSEKEPQTVSLEPPKAGSYRIRANFAGASSDTTATDFELWVTGGDAVTWFSEEPNRLDVKLDKDLYQPGETATALIQSPYPEAELYLAVVRHDTIYRTIETVKGGAPRVQFRITPDMVPNAAVCAVLVRKGSALATLEPGKVETLSRIGFAPFHTKLDDKHLKVRVAPKRSSLAPGAEQTVRLRLSDAQGRPARGQFTVMVVNEAILQLTGYHPPDLVNTVFADQAISTRFADNRPNVVLRQQRSPLQKGWGYGGGFLAGAAGTRIRKDFRPLAYYNGSVLADAAGAAQITFKLPDDLTTWRVMAVATGAPGDTPSTALRFGNGEATFITTKPLLSNPVLPQFARPGDLLDAGLAVTNNTGRNGALDIAGELSGFLRFVDGEHTSLTTSLKTQSEAGTRAYRFRMIVGNDPSARMRFLVKLGEATDAFEVPLALRTQDVTEQAIESGATRDRAMVPLDVVTNVAPDAGGLDVSIASTLLPEITAPGREALNQDELPFLEPVASRLSIAANLQIIGRQYGQRFAGLDLPQLAAKNLEDLRKLQKPSGGFGWWPGAKHSDPVVSAYAAQSIALARAAGFATDSEMPSRLKTYLKQVLADPTTEETGRCTSALCNSLIRLHALEGLAALGEEHNDFLQDIYDQRDRFDLATRMRLARYLFRFPEWKTQAEALAQKLEETIYETGRTATVNFSERWSWLDSPTALQAQALRLVVAQKARPELVDRVLRGLLALRRHGKWPLSCDVAEALDALVEYSRIESTPPSFSATVSLAGKTLSSTRFAGYSNPQRDFAVPMARLPRNKNDVILEKAGEGTLHYVVAYRYRLLGVQPGVMSGLRVTREIRPANQENAIARLGLSAPAGPLQLQAGQVFDVGLEIITDHPVNQLVITDPLPAGLEAVDTTFQTSTKYFQGIRDSWQIDFQNIYRDRVVAYGDHLEAGVYSFHYLVRSVTPGTYFWPGCEVRVQYSPEEFGRSASATLKVM